MSMDERSDRTYQHRWIALSIIGIVVVCVSCRQKFDKRRWTESVESTIPDSYRSEVLPDLLENRRLVGLRTAELTHLLGQPDFTDSVSITYKIIEEYGFDIDPVRTKDVVFEYSSDSVVTSYSIVEWRK